MPGPPPKHPSERRRRNATVPMTRLPAEGRRGDPPEWPLAGPRKRELAIWAELWSTPQAVVWERLGWFRPVARYARLLYEVEKPGATAARLAEARQMEDRLGLSPMAMLRLRWEVVADEVAERRDEAGGSRGSMRDRLKVVDAAGP